MVELHAALADRVAGWRTEGYPTERFPAIAEILQFATEDHDGEAPGTGTLRYLRAAQLRALETYWYLRLVEGTPRIPEEHADRPAAVRITDMLGEEILVVEDRA